MRQTITLVNRPGMRKGDLILVGDRVWKVTHVEGTTITIRRRRDWWSVAFVVMVVILVLLAAAIALAKPRARQFVGPVNYTWEYIGEGRTPATLRDCPPQTVISVSQSSQVGVWQRFCHFGRRA